MKVFRFDQSTAQLLKNPKDWLELGDCARHGRLGVELGPNVFVSGNGVESARPCAWLQRAWEKKEAQGVQYQCSSKS